ncbi:RHS repeat-associated core domain-containing protein [Haliscomenobacter hydrossis]|uniref:RHS repeat-associated core domain protein n=1 Tax=Haliscomenobacter hydrossis (strain ATCC 27775 / DSM 1100 / LMG 10767 / O) TaxID=760192 RepID=F4L403_HALH1|nr:RHS repeat-associated core domain-containing protein [Haliscomenobacter hydrossis]AEE49720.1 RHS repeat-associated core domain protein [Haliscomenobacter hydrossis DSM 1100]
MKTKPSFIIYILGLLFGLPSLFFAQPANKYIQDVSMPSPSAASLGKYGEVPVSYFTGVPNISIPIHTLQEGPLSLPISVSYHASGVKVAEPASWVGTGWNLNTGGMISRTVLNIKDEEAGKGYYVVGAGLQYNSSDITEALNGTKDSEPDIFSFNFLGYSGKFSFDAVANTWRIVPKQDVRIEHGNNFEHFKITLPDGTVGYFGKTPGGQIAYEYTDPALLGGDRYLSGWYLLRIETHDAKYAITFNYAQDKYSFRSPATMAYYKSAGSTPGSFCSSSGITEPTPDQIQQTYYYTNKMDGLRLSSIKTSTEKLEFIAVTTRTDLGTYGATPPKRLDTIKLKTDTLNASFCMKWAFSYDYFMDNYSNQCNALASDPHCQRLKLTQIKEQSCDGAQQKSPYSFEYEGSTVSVNGQNKQFLPNALSKATDHWGFYNGVHSNNTKLVNIPLTTLNFGSFGVESYGQSNRNTDESQIKAGVLKKIIYPTGGHTSFTYEANDYQELITNYTREYLINEKDELTNCEYATNACCSSQTDMGTITFEANHNFAADSFRLEIIDTECSSTQFCYAGPVSVAIEVRNNVTNALLKTYNFGLAPGAAEGVIEDALTQLYNGFGQSTYKLVLCASGGKGTFSVFRSSPNNQYVNTKIGGLRIKEIRSHDAVSSTTNDIIKTYQYQSSGSSNSSGKLFFKPIYGYALNHSFEASAYNYFYFQDVSVVPMGSYDGYHIGYQRVVESLNGNGKNVFLYWTEEPTSFIPTDFPAAPGLAAVSRGENVSTTIQHENGQILEQVANTKNGDVYSNTASVVFKVYKAKLCTNQFIVGATRYYPRTAPYRLAQQTTYKDGISTTTTYTYANAAAGHLAPIARNFYTNSDGKIHSTYYYYAHEMSNRSSAPPAYAELKARNMITIPLEQVEYVDGVQVKGTRTEYGFFNSSGNNVASLSSGVHPYPYKFWNYEMTWDASNMVSISGSDGWLLRGTINTYHPDAGTGKGYPKQFTQTNWSPETYEWKNGLITQRTYNNFVWKYRYYSGTRLMSGITNIDGQRDSFEYDKLTRLKKIWSRGGNVVTNYTYYYKGVSSTNNYVETMTNYTAVSGSTMTQKGVRQYFDGLGRVMQAIKRQHHSIKGPDGAAYGASDVIVNMEYDNQGRLIKTTRPYQGYSDGTYYAPPGGTQFTLTQYESSPLNRAISITPPNGYATTTTYGTNGSTITIPGGTSYSANTLLESKVTDPDNRVNYTYQDKRGRVVLVKKTNISNTSPAETYYTYDDKDRVAKVVPPGATLSNADLIYKYEYSFNDLVLKKKIPGAADVNMQYNNRDLLALTQDGNLAAQNKSMGITYDTYGRPLKTGFVTGFPGTPNSFAFVDTISRIFYDGEGGGITPNLSLTTYPQYRGKIRCTKVKVLGSASTFLNSTLRYDTYGRVLSTKGNNYLDTGNNNADSTTFTYDWMDTKLVDLRMHNPGSGAATGTQNIRHDHRYDHAGRLINYLFKLNNDELHIAEYNYDTYDQMVERNLHANFTAGAWGWLQSVDYTYNNMGWLSKINSNGHTGTALAFPTASCSPTLPNPGSTTRTLYPETNDLFYLELRYDQLFDNTAGGGNISGITGGTVQKAGNISQLAYRVRGRDRQAYNFSYDHLSRLTTATYYDVNGSNTATNTSRFNENLTYDIRGNISTLQRQGYYSSTCNYGQIDNLSYTYASNANRLTSISESAPMSQRSHGFNPGSGGTGYTYDANGNLNADTYKGISSITYNHLNLPSVITYSNGNTIEIVYDANGGKLRKIVKVGATVQYEQDYLGGLEYRKVGSNAKRLEAVYHAEGRYYNLNVEMNNTLSIRYEYSLRDHLGNTRLTFTDKNANGIVDITNTPSTNDILQENHYYPFGANYEGPWLMNDAARDTKYQFNGKEMNDDFGLNWMDYGARWYDAAIGRFTGVDPISEKFPHVTTYNYAENEPIANIDLWGLQQFYAADGALLGQIGDNTDARLVENDDDIETVRKYIRWANTAKSDKARNYNIGIAMKASQDVGMSGEELNLRATLSTIKQAEAGRSNEPLDYNSWNNGANFTEDSYADNPEAYSTHPGEKPGIGGTAAGAYQFLERFYSESDFSPESQDRAAVKLMTSKGYKAATKGDMADFIDNSKSRWTSLKHWSVNQLQAKFQQYRAKELKGKTNIATPSNRGLLK